jgi:hypothetical protein
LCSVPRTNAIPAFIMAVSLHSVSCSLSNREGEKVQYFFCFAYRYVF